MFKPMELEKHIDEQLTADLERLGRLRQVSADSTFKQALREQLRVQAQQQQANPTYHAVRPNKLAWLSGWYGNLSYIVNTAIVGMFCLMLMPLLMSNMNTVPETVYQADHILSDERAINHQSDLGEPKSDAHTGLPDTSQHPPVTIDTFAEFAEFVAKGHELHAENIPIYLPYFQK